MDDSKEAASTEKSAQQVWIKVKLAQLARVIVIHAI